MLETLGLDIAPRAASVWLGLGLGLAFGALAEVTRFCLRRALVGDLSQRRPAGALWLVALATAIAGTQAVQAAGLIDLGDHRFLAGSAPVLAILAGGLLFGAGMVLARGCPARLTVLAGTGNLRALAVVVLIAIVAHATLKGLFSPLRVMAESLTWNLPHLSALPFAGVLVCAGLLGLAIRFGARGATLAQGAAIGALVPLAWMGTGWFLTDDFDPVAVEAISFTAPLADTLFWTIASSSVAANFGIGLFLGTLAGAAASALIGRRSGWQSFTSPRETGRYAAGAVLMGFGGVLAGGCTLGAGLSGVSTLSTSAALGLGAIIAGALATERLLSASSSGYGAPSARPAPQPAE